MTRRCYHAKSAVLCPQWTADAQASSAERVWADRVSVSGTYGIFMVWGAKGLDEGVAIDAGLTQHAGQGADGQIPVIEAQR